tara:strand:- start:31071 stop:31889 length:819 start_codon:yes stop_codon:yes gene_type:complete
MSVLLIGGAPRTGTSLLNAILCSDPAVHPMMPEATYLRYLMRAYRYGQDAFEAEVKEYFAHPEGLNAFTASQVEALCDALELRFPTTRHQVFRSPRLTPVLADLLNILPDARGMVMVRDPRDVVASLFCLHDRQIRAGQQSWLTRAGRSADYLAKAYNGFYAPVSNLPDKSLYKRLLTVRYEDLVQLPDENIERIASYSGLALSGFAGQTGWRSELIDETVPDIRPGPDDLWGKPISDRQVGAFHKVLNEAETDVVQEICSAYMAGFGYQPV